MTWKNIFVNPGLGELYVGGMWMSAIIEDIPISVFDALSTEYVGAPSCNLFIFLKEDNMF